MRPLILTAQPMRGRMDLYPTAETYAGTPGSIAPADGNYSASVAPASSPANLDNAAKDYDDRQQDAGATDAPLDLGPNNERLEELKPELVNALRELVRQYRQEGIVARRHEIRRIRQARLFWQGLQYAWWNPNDMNWHLPFEQRFNDDRELEEMPRYQFVTNFYQGFGLSFIAVLSQDVPSVRFYPQSAQSLEDIGAARAASDVAELIEQNNRSRKSSDLDRLFSLDRRKNWRATCATSPTASASVFTKNNCSRRWKFRLARTCTFAQSAEKKHQRPM